MSALDDLTSRFSQTCFYACPANQRLDPEAAVTTDGNRWSAPGEPTIYLASDLGVALAEFARHAPTHQPVDGRVWAVELELTSTVDLRRVDVRARLGVGDDPAWFLDRDRCRSLAHKLRTDGAIDGLIVPSVAMLDQDARFNVVVFVDRLPVGLSVAVAPRTPVMDIAPAYG
jgi:RES domain-containing protein